VILNARPPQKRLPEFAHPERSLANTETFLEERLDLARPGAIAAQFDLTGGAAEEADVAIGRKRARSPVRWRMAIEG
jgi:hypothetical protein